MNVSLARCLLIISCLAAFSHCKGQASNRDAIVKKLNFSAAVLIAKNGSSKDSLLAAEYLLDSAIHLNPSYYNSYQNKSVVEWNLGRFDDALKDVDEVLNIKNDFAEVKMTKGLMLEKLNRNEEATKSYQAAVIDYTVRLKKDSTNLNSLVDLALLTMLLESKDKGIIAFDKIYKMHPNDQWLIYTRQIFYSFDRKKFIDEQLTADSPR